MAPHGQRTILHPLTKLEGALWRNKLREGRHGPLLCTAVTRNVWCTQHVLRVAGPRQHEGRTGLWSTEAWPPKDVHIQIPGPANVFLSTAHGILPVWLSESSWLTPVGLM